MTPAEEFAARGCRPADGELAALEAALFLEDCYGVVLSDGDIVTENLDTAQAMAMLVERKRGR